MVSPYSVGVPGGAQRQAVALAAALARVGVEVEVLAPTGPGGPPPDDPVAEVPFVGLGRAVAISVNGSRAPVAPFPWTAARALRLLRARRYDVVHLHEPFVPGPTLAALAVGPRPLVGTFHRAGSDAAYRALGRGLGRLAGRLGAAVAVSEAARDTAAGVLGVPPVRFEVLWNGVEVEAFERARPIVGTRPAVLFIGRHEARKGLGVLLEAFASVEADAELWVCGSGPETAALQARHPDDPRVMWLGRVGDEELRGRMAGATVFCSPALGGESFGLVLAEAMAAGTAVVASDLPGYRAALAGAGVLVRPGDAGTLAGALSDLLAAPRRRADLVAAGRARARALSVDTLAGRYMEIYERVRAKV